MIKTQFFISFFFVTFTYKTSPQKNIFSSYPLKPNSHTDNSLAAIPLEILTNPLPPPLPKNNIAYNISKLLVKLKKKETEANNKHVNKKYFVIVANGWR